MSLFSVRRANPIDIRQDRPWLQTYAARRWFASSQPDHSYSGSGSGAHRAAHNDNDPARRDSRRV